MQTSLDQLSQGLYLGGKTILGQLYEMKLVYGKLVNTPIEGISKHVCFGLKDKVTHFQTEVIYK